MKKGDRIHAASPVTGNSFRHLFGSFLGWAVHAARCAPAANQCFAVDVNSANICWCKIAGAIKPVQYGTFLR